jgi:hypothetical protein
MHQISDETDHIKTVAAIDGIFILSINIFSLLRVVGLSQLHQ